MCQLEQCRRCCRRFTCDDYYELQKKQEEYDALCRDSYENVEQNEEYDRAWREAEDLYR